MRTILIIEDDEPLRSSMKAICELEELNVLTAADGIAGLQMALDQPPDLVLCDLHLPKLDGYEIVKRLHENERTARIPVVIVTASANLKAVQQTAQIGPEQILGKPFQVTKLLDLIKYWLDLS